MQCVNEVLKGEPSLRLHRMPSLRHLSYLRYSLAHPPPTPIALRRIKHGRLKRSSVMRLRDTPNGANIRSFMQTTQAQRIACRPYQLC
jgi:hypothetical protein